MPIDAVNSHKNKVHKILAHSYSVYFAAFLLGIILDFSLRLKIFYGNVNVVVGVSIIILATALIFWAQKTNRDLDLRKGDIQKNHFCKGPYCYTRSPTHWGLFLLMLGFGVMIDAPFVLLLTFVALVVTKIFFLGTQEKILEQKYGSPYKEYKQKVKL